MLIDWSNLFNIYYSLNVWCASKTCAWYIVVVSDTLKKIIAQNTGFEFGWPGLPPLDGQGCRLKYIHAIYLLATKPVRPGQGCRLKYIHAWVPPNTRRHLGMLKYFLPVLLGGAATLLLVQIFRLLFLLLQLVFIKCGYWQINQTTQTIDPKSYIIIINPFSLKPSLASRTCRKEQTCRKESSASTKHPTSETPLLSVS